MSVAFRELGLGVVEVRPARFDDDRGFFSETWNSRSFAGPGMPRNFVQDNHSYSRERGVLRGLHYQLSPMAQAKLVRVLRGAIFDVAVDIRPNSPTFCKWVGLEVSADAWNQIFVPDGLAHGFVTLEPNTEILYKVTRHYSPECERSIRFDDPQIAIEWPIPSSNLMLSDKDRLAPFLSASDLYQPA